MFGAGSTWSGDEARFVAGVDAADRDSAPIKVSSSYGLFLTVLVAKLSGTHGA